MRRRLAVILVSLLATATLYCTPNQPGGGGLQNHPAFQLTYVDRNGNVRVRYSDDGLTWGEGSISALHNAGVGASATPDVAGVTRVVADPGSQSRLRLWFGLGPETFDNTPVVLPNLRPAGRPTIVDVGRNRYLIAFLPPNSQSFELWFYNHVTRQSYLVAFPGAVGNDSLLFAPAMAFLPADPAANRSNDRVAIAWARYPQPQWRRPSEIRTMYVDITPAGGVTAGRSNFVIKSDSMPPSFTWATPALLSPPAMAHDHTQFILVSHQHFVRAIPAGFSRATEYVQMHTSPDGIHWQRGLWDEFRSTRVLDEPALVEYAVQPDCRAVLVVMPLGSNYVHAQLYLQGSTTQAIPVTQIFGTLPAEAQFSLMSTGRPAVVPAGGCGDV